MQILLFWDVAPETLTLLPVKMQKKVKLDSFLRLTDAQTRETLSRIP